MVIINLGGLVLPAGLQWTDRYQVQNVQQSVDTALDGSPVVFAAAKQQGRIITLEAFEDSGWMTQNTTETLISLAQMPLNPATALNFVYDDFQSLVLFAHHTPPAVDLKPLWPFAQVYSGRIVLITV